MIHRRALPLAALDQNDFQIGRQMASDSILAGSALTVIRSDGDKRTISGVFTFEIAEVLVREGPLPFATWSS